METKNSILNKINKIYSNSDSISILNNLICDYAMDKFQIIKIKNLCVCDEYNHIYYLKCLIDAFANPDNFDALLLEEFEIKSLVKYINDIIYEYSLCIIELLDVKNQKSENCIASLDFLKTITNILEDGEK